MTCRIVEGWYEALRNGRLRRVRQWTVYWVEDGEEKWVVFYMKRDAERFMGRKEKQA